MTEFSLSLQSNTPIVIEEGRRLSESLLWQLQRAYFVQQGLAAWRDSTVPYYITNNPTIARCYAQLVFGWLRDLTRGPQPLDLTQPIYVLELGAGSGQLGFHVLRQLHTLLENSVLKHLPVRYVLTDFSPSTLESWQAHPQLKALLDSGYLDLARFDVTQDRAITLLNSGRTLTTGELKNPMAVIANYVFDSLPQDIFKVEGGQLFESLVTLTSTQPELERTDPRILPWLRLSYQHQPAQTPVYADPAFNAILESYRQAVKHSHIPFPSASLACLGLLRQWTQDRLLVITGDKGFHHAADLENREEPGLTVHGSFSMSVNMHAVGEYTTAAGGLFLSTEQRRVNLDICGMVFGGGPDSFTETQQAYALAVAQGGPDDFYTVKKFIDARYADMDVPQLLAYLRLSGWDSNVFVGCFLILLQKLGEAGPDLKMEVRRAVGAIWENYYFLGEDKDVPFALGLVLMEMAAYVEAIPYFEISLTLHGPDASAYYYLGVCHIEMHDLEQARDYARMAVEANPGFEPAGALLTKINDELAKQ